MTKFLLVGITHNVEANDLMNADCKGQFREKITPLLSNKSVIFTEGYYAKTLIQENSKIVSSMNLREVLEGKKPTFGFCDPRWNKNPTKITSLSKAYRDWITIANRKFRFLHEPQTWEEVEHAVMNDFFEYKITQELTKDDLKLAQRINLAVKKFNRNYLQAMKLQLSADICIFVGGLAHALSLTKASGYEFINLDTDLSRKQPSQIYLGYASTHICPSLALKHK